MSEIERRPKAYSYLRMSTERQLLGDSLRRQEEASRRYAEENGLDLVSQNEMHDIGVSAFKGLNLSKGALGAFVDSVRAGKVAAGSFLIVESFDRLSRQEVISALSLFISLNEAGINIVTLSDSQVYKTGETNVMQLMYSIMIMGRAHEESKIKSQRISAAWEDKRKQINHKKLTAKSVGWLKLADDRRSFEIIEERAELVRRIFNETADGIGAFSIVRRLNHDGARPFGHAKQWQKSSVDKIILSRAVLGEFQPQRRTENGVEPAGPLLADYYPRIVEEGLFYRAQAARAARRQGSAGRRGSRVSNLFSGLATCGYCGARMHYLNKGPSPKAGRYLICDAANRGSGCSTSLWRYADFERSFLTFVEELDLEPLAQPAGEAQERLDLASALQELQGRLSELQMRQARTYEMHIADPEIDFLKAKLREASASISEVEREMTEKRQRLDVLRDSANSFYESREQVKALVNQLQSECGADMFELRTRVATKLKGIIASLQLFNAGKTPDLNMMLQSLRDNKDPIQSEDLIDFFEGEVEDPFNRRPYFIVSTKYGSVRKLMPVEGDPTELHEEIRRTDTELLVRRGEHSIDLAKRYEKKLERHSFAETVSIMRSAISERAPPREG